MLSLKSLLAPYEDQYGKDYLIGIINSYIMPVVREELMLIIEEEDDLINRYNEIKSMIHQEVPFEMFFESILGLVEECLIKFSSQIKKSKTPIGELAKDYIDQHYRSDISLAQVSKSLYTSKEYLAGAFKQKYQMTLGQYILQKKMDEAGRLLIEGVSQQEVARILSYQDPTYFYKVFKKYYDCTPGEYTRGNE